MDELHNRLDKLKLKEIMPDTGQPSVPNQLETTSQLEEMTEDWKKFYAEVRKAVERMRE